MEKVTENYTCPSFIKFGIVYHQGTRDVMGGIGGTITENISHILESSWDKITAGLKFVQCQKLKCALKFLKKIVDDPFLGQPIPINTNIELKENRREKNSC